MPQRRRARGLLAGLVFVTLVLITIDFRAGADGPVQTLRKVATSAFGPLQRGATGAVAPVAQGFDDVGGFFDLRAENERLRRELEEAELAAQSYQSLLLERDQLRLLVSIVAGGEFAGIGARTIANSPSNFEWLITIDVGSDDGITADLPVINGSGLVGRVLQVGPSSSRVLLAIDPTFFAASRVSTGGEVGTTRGRGADLLLFSPLDPDGVIGLGDEVVTSSFEGGLYPTGIPIGTVEDPGLPTNGMTRQVGVRPFVDFTTLDHLFIVTGGAS